jgi:hypothetical protein
MRTFKSLLFSIFVILILSGAASATQVRGHLVDANGQPLIAGRIEFVLGGCPTESGPATLLSGGNLTNYGPYPIKSGPGGTIIGQIIGSDQILCGGGLNTYWQVSGYNGNTLSWTKAAIITGGLWQADTGPYLNVSPTALPPNPVLQNPISDQIVVVPAGKKLQVTGTFIASLTGNATTATSLAANGTNCSAGSFPLGVDDSGNAEGCTPATTITGTANQVIASAASGAITLSLPQSIATSSAPTFAGLTLNGSLAFSTNAFLQADAANALALRNGLNPQTFNVYGTFTDASNFERLTVGWNASNSVFAIDAGSAGTGIARSLFIRTGNVSRWNFASTGGLSAVTDNTLDFGASGSGRPRNIFAGTSINADNTGVATAVANFGSAGLLWNSSYWNGTIPIIDTLTLKTIPGTGTNPTEALTLSHTGTPGVLSVDLSAAATVKVTTVNATSGYQVNGAAFGFSNLAGTLAATQGGTGQTTFAIGDLLLGAAGNSISKLTIGGSGLCLTSNGTTAVWGACGAGAASLSATNTFTGTNTFSNIVAVSGFSGVPVTTAASMYLGGGFGSPVSGRIYFTDSANWQLKLSARDQSTTSDEFTFVGSPGIGFFGVNTSISVHGTVVIPTLVTGGTLTSGTPVFYKVTAIGPDSTETDAMPEVTATPTGTTLSVSLTWAGVTGAASYRVYRGTSAGGESTFQTTAAASFTDTGAAGTAGTPPAFNNSYLSKLKNGPGSYIYAGLGVGTTAPSSSFALDVAGNSITSLSNVARFKSAASSNSFVTLDTTTAGFQATLLYLDAGTSKWQEGKDATNNFIVFESTSLVNRINLNASGNNSYQTGNTTGVHTFQHSDGSLAAINASQFQVSGVALAASNLSNGVTGSGAVTLAGAPTISSPILTGVPTTSDTTNPVLRFNATTNPVDQKVWDIVATGTTLVFRADNDAVNNSTAALTLNRGTGFSISSVTIGTPGWGGVLQVAAQDGTNEGGELHLIGAAANTTGIIDTLAGNIRLFGGAANPFTFNMATGALTNIVLDAEGSGNNITTVTKLWYPAAGCSNSAPTSYWDMGTSSIPTAVCVTGTNIVKGLLRYTGSTLASQFHYKLPDDLATSTAWDVRTFWTTGTASGTAILTIDYACTAAGATDDPAWTTAWLSQSLAASATVNAININTVSALTTTCTAGQMIHFRVRRTDTAGTATNMDVYGVELTYRRTE